LYIKSSWCLVILHVCILMHFLVENPQKKYNKIFELVKSGIGSSIVATPLWAKCKNATPTPKSGDLESSGTPKNSEDDLRGQISSPCCVPYINEKLLKRRCPKWPRIAHLDIYSSSYGQKKGQESNCQFDSRPLKVGNRPLSDVASWSATRRWKALDERYNFGLELVSIQVWSEELQPFKVPRLQPGTVSRLQLGSPGKKSHLDVASAVRCREYYMGEGDGFPWVRAMVSLVCKSARGLSQHPRVFLNAN
jgi:hypothetical protein